MVSYRIHFNTHAGVHKHAQSLVHTHVKVSSYIARYPVLMTVNALHILCPWQTCSINDLSTALGSIQPCIGYILQVIYIGSCILPVEMSVIIYTVYMNFAE